MGSSLRPVGGAGKAARGSNLGQGVSEIPAGIRHPPSDEQIREQAADATRRATYGIGPHVGGDLGLDPSIVYKWTNGERRSPGESVAKITLRSLTEAKQPRENSLAIVTWLALLFLTPEELEGLAIQSRVEDLGPGQVLKLARLEAEDLLARPLSAQDAMELGVEVNRALQALYQIQAILNVRRFGGDGAAEKEAARG